MPVFAGIAAAVMAAQAPLPPVAAAMQGVNCASSTLCEGGTLPAFLAKLHFANRAGAPIHILQIGDSHTAGDMITNGYRTRLQARYGNGGRGVLAAGRPYSGYITFGVTASESAGWRTNSLYGGAYTAGGPALGISGFTQSVRGSGQTLGVSADSPDFAFDKVIVCALIRPGAGTVSVRMGGQELVWSLDAGVPGAACRSLESQSPTMSASITTLDDNPVSITSFGTFHRRGGGVVVSNVGVVGAQLVHLGRTDDDVVRHEIAAYRPDLIVLAYGTNEGFGGAGNPSEYEGVLRGQINRLRRLAGPNVAIMLLGAPDASSHNAGLGSGCGAGWYTPNFLGQVREVQRRVARDLRLGYWDWEQAMGGRCASQAWLSQGLMRGDSVHFTREGGDRIGAMLFGDLERAQANVVPRTGAFGNPSGQPDPRRRPD